MLNAVLFPPPYTKDALKLGFFMVHLMDAESYWRLESLGDEAILWAFSHVS